jgi:phage tail-like protein
VDANHTRFHLLLGRPDWAACSHDGVTSLGDAWDAGAGVRARAGIPEPDVEYDDTREELALRSLIFRFTSPYAHGPEGEGSGDAGRRELGASDRRGAGRDRYGNWYWIGEGGDEILVRSSGTDAISRFWSAATNGGCEPPGQPGDFRPVEPVAAPSPLRLSGLAVTEHHYLVVGELDGPGLLVFDLHAGGPPERLLWPVRFRPFDMSPSSDGGVWILDRLPTSPDPSARLWKLDRQLNVVWLNSEDAVLSPEHEEDFGPVGGAPRRSPERSFPLGLGLEGAATPAPADAVAVEGLPDGTALLLDNPPGAGPRRRLPTVYRLDPGALRALDGIDSLLRLVEEEREENGRGFRLCGHDMAFVPAVDRRPGGSGELGVLYIVATNGNQTFAFDLREQGGKLALRARNDYLPMRLFGGKALVAGPPGSQPSYDFGDGWIPLIEQKRPRYVDEGALLTPLYLYRYRKPQPLNGAASPESRHAFDGRDPDCVWHRLMLDGCIPPGTEVRVESRAANEERELELMPWQREPEPYLRSDGSELPWMPKSGAERDGTWELLFQRARGRYLQLRLTLRGNGRTTPRLRALRAYYPRFSYLAHYLPAVYREDDESASFLDRFLANVEGFYTAIEDRIASAQVLFDVRSAPAETLAWLAGWFEVGLDPAWDERRARLFLGNAMEFFRWRGTARGLLMALRLALDECADESIFSDAPRPGSVRIVERFLSRRAPAVVYGDPTERSGQPAATPRDRWRPSDGGEALRLRYYRFLQERGLPASEVFPLTAPTDPALAAAWERFSEEVLGFVPSAAAGDAPAFRAFLARRYRRIGALNQAYPQEYRSFDTVGVPAALPVDGAPLRDWYQFESVVLASRRTAHRFTVLLPVGGNGSTEEQLARLGLVRRIVELQKPAHTTFDVRFFWAAFRVGEARLGADTLIDLGSRATNLAPPLVLGHSYLAEGHLAPGYPQNIAGRQVVGRDRVVPA